MFTALRCPHCHHMFRVQPHRDRDTWSGSLTRLCPDCRGLPAAVVSVDNAALVYEGSTRRLVSDLKFRGRQSAARALAAELARSVRADGRMFEVVTWAPTSTSRRRRRGFDQSELIARLVARDLRIPCRCLLVRESGPAQTGRTRHARLSGPTFRARPTRAPLNVLVIDDVVTTGATLRAAAHALGSAGWADVATLAAAATPDRRQTPARSRTVAIAPD
ncbi:MAG: hypothetical protein B7C54_11185 [Acidimicrobiales bacterium mtb01]|nr:ComF family protein [Actinomycetota bacterium]TEX45614.1 MAG: hypothetical protein B7C54_11185 [Acidimicrobiales bacterium mtb01]